MEEHGIFRRRRLPHWDLPGATYFITTCLAGSIPAEGLLDVAPYRDGLLRLARARRTLDAAEELQCWRKTFARADWWLDRRPAVRHLADPALAASLVDACYFWAGRRYDLLAYVVMPSHFHWVFRPLVGQADNLPQPERSSKPAEQAVNLCKSRQVNNLPHIRSPRERIMHTLKRHTARQCNRLLDRCGAFWQDESYDHCVRDEEELERIIQYVESNPVKAGLTAQPEQRPFSSARDRSELGLLLGQSLTRPTLR